MSYLGASTTLQTVAPGIDYFSGNASTTTFQLSRQIVAVQDILVYIDNVPQNPSTAYSINTATNQITFTSAPLSGTNNIWVYYNTKTIQMLAPSQGTVGQAQMLNPTGTGSPVLASSPTLVTPTINQINNSVPGSSLGAGNASIMKNRIINGAMTIDQRNAGAGVAVGSTTVAGNYAPYTVDRWLAQSYTTTTGAGVAFTAQQNLNSVTPPVGFSNYLGITVTTSRATMAATTICRLMQSIEGFNTADLAWGTANAKTITASFWVYSSLTGTFGGAIMNSGGTASYPFTYSISAANTWQQITLTIAGPTIGTWLTNNGIGLQIMFALGTDSANCGTAGVWAATSYFGATGQTNIMSTNGATFYITGVQLEVGTSATGYEYRQYQQELALCQRYYQFVKAGMTYAGVTTGQYFGISVTYPTAMRASPTVVRISDDFASNVGTPTADNATLQGFRALATATGSGAAFQTLYSASIEL